MFVPVMDVRKVRVTVADRRVLMFMGVWLDSVPLERMLMLMMFVMNVPVAMKECEVLMFMGMTFLEVDPDAQPHQQ